MDDARWAGLRALAAKQGGLITRQQALGTGCSESGWRELTLNRLQPIARGIFELDPGGLDDHRDLRVALLMAGDEAVVSHRAAARLHRFWCVDGFSAEVTAPRRLALELPGLTVHRGKVDPDDQVTLSGLRVTSRVRTLLDLAQAVDWVTLAAMLESARRTQPDVALSLAARIPGAGFSRGLERALGIVLADCDARARPMDSPFEIQFWHRWPFTGLPMPVPQYEVQDSRGRMYLDFAWPAQKVVVETMGYETRQTKESFDGDGSRAGRLNAMGWWVIQVTYEMFRTEFFRLVVSAVASALKERSR